MASIKALLFVSFLVAAGLAAAPIAEAQFGGLLSGVLGLISVQGTVFCTANGRVSSAGAALTPVFANATVVLQCANGNVATTTTNGSGVFSILLDPLQFLLSSLLNNCKIVVTTPLSTCNSSFSGITGLLESALQIIGNILLGVLSVTKVVPVGFILSN